MTIYTPGSTAGVPLNVIGSLQRPQLSWDDRRRGAPRRDRGHGDEPPRARRHRSRPARPAASTSCSRTSSSTRGAPGRDLDLGTLIGEIQTPPLRKLGVFEVDQFFPPAERTKLAFTLNALVASPTFAAWGEGEPLDPQTLLFTPEGKPRCAIVYLAHLSEEERQFVVTLVFSKLVTWMRGQEGTPDLRALAYMDEVFGYVPPTAVAAAEEADPDDLQAGPRVRARPRALDPEPRRPRLQGDVERGHVARRPAPDRERQGAGARRAPLGCGRHRRRRARQGDRRARQAAVPARLGKVVAAAPARDALGDVVPRRPADEGAGRAADRWRDPHRDGRRCSPSPQQAVSRRPQRHSAATRPPSRRRRDRRARLVPRPGGAVAGEVGAVPGWHAAARVPRGPASRSATTTARAGVDEQQEFEAVYGPLDGGLDLDSERQRSTTTTATSAARRPPPPRTCCRAPVGEKPFFDEARTRSSSTSSTSGRSSSSATAR